MKKSQKILALKREVKALKREAEILENMLTYLANKFENDYFNVVSLLHLNALLENADFIQHTNSNVKATLNRLRIYIKDRTCVLGIHSDASITANRIINGKHEEFSI